MADDLVGQFTFSKTETQTTDFSQFRDESSDIAQHVYDGLRNDKTFVVPDSYINKYAPIAKRRVVLAAHRLVFAM